MSTGAQGGQRHQPLPLLEFGISGSCVLPYVGSEGQSGALQE